MAVGRLAVTPLMAGLARVRAIWSREAVAKWSKTTAMRAIRMAQEGAWEARITVGGLITSAMVTERLTVAGFRFQPLDDGTGDFVISWWRETGAADSGVHVHSIPFERLAAALPLISSQKPRVDRHEAAHRIAVADAIAQVETSASLLHDTATYKLGARDVSASALVIDLEKRGFQVEFSRDLTYNRSDAANSLGMDKDFC